MKSEEAILIEACLNKDQRAMKELYDRYAPSLYGICLRYAHSAEVAKDLLHDGFIKVFENLKYLHDYSSLYAWMRSIIINTSITMLRNEKYGVETCVDDNVDLDSLAQTNSSYEMIDRLDVHIILEAIQKLSPALRLAFNLCEIEGLSCTEASKDAGVSESTIRANLTRAKQQLSIDLIKYLE